MGFGFLVAFVALGTVQHHSLRRGSDRPDLNAEPSVVLKPLHLQQEAKARVPQVSHNHTFGSALPHDQTSTVILGEKHEIHFGVKEGKATKTIGKEDQTTPANEEFDSTESPENTDDPEPDVEDLATTLPPDNAKTGVAGTLLKQLHEQVRASPLEEDGTDVVALQAEIENLKEELAAQKKFNDKEMLKLIGEKNEADKKEQAEEQTLEADSREIKHLKVVEKRKLADDLEITKLRKEYQVAGIKLQNAVQNLQTQTKLYDDLRAEHKKDKQALDETRDELKEKTKEASDMANDLTLANEKLEEAAKVAERLEKMTKERDEAVEAERQELKNTQLFDEGITSIKHIGSQVNESMAQIIESKEDALAVASTMSEINTRLQALLVKAHQKQEHTQKMLDFLIQQNMQRDNVTSASNATDNDAEDAEATVAPDAADKAVVVAAQGNKDGSADAVVAGVDSSSNNEEETTSAPTEESNEQESNEEDVTTESSASDGGEEATDAPAEEESTESPEQKFKELFLQSMVKTPTELV